MDSDISPIFADVQNEPSTNTMDATPLEQVTDDHHQQIHSQENDQYMYYQQPQPTFQQQAPVPVTPNSPHWDPFSTIGVTSWVVIGIVFIIGFIVGKLR